MAPHIHKNQSTCDSCDVAYHAQLPCCAAVGCDMRICRWCSFNGICADCIKEQRNAAAFTAAWNERERMWLLAVLLLSGGSVGGTPLPRVGG